MKMWAIKMPNGTLYHVAHFARWSRDEFLNVYRDARDDKMRTWKYWYRRGYRCVRVEVKEIKG